MPLHIPGYTDRELFEMGCCDLPGLANRAALHIDEIQLGRHNDETEQALTILIAWFQHFENELAASIEKADWSYDLHQLVFCKRVWEQSPWYKPDITLISELLPELTAIRERLEHCRPGADSEFLTTMVSFCCDVSKCASADDEYGPHPRGRYWLAG